MVIRAESHLVRIGVPAIVAMLVVVAFSAYGARGGNGDLTFFACLEPRSGTLYGVGTEPPQCNRGHDSISWSKSGGAGEPGKDGAPGEDGEPGIANLNAVESEPFVPNGLGPADLYAVCPSGQVPVSGGHAVVGFENGVELENVEIDRNGSPRVFAVQNHAVAGEGGDNPHNFRTTDELEPGEFGWYVRLDSPPDLILLQQEEDPVGAVAIAYCADVAGNGD